MSVRRESASRSISSDRLPDPNAARAALGLFRLPDGEQERRVIDLLGVGGGLARGRILGEGLQQVACAIGSEGLMTELVSRRR